MTSSTFLRQDLADELAAQGLLTDPAWRAALEAVPRELFLGDALFHQDGLLNLWDQAEDALDA